MLIHCRTQICVQCQAPDGCGDLDDMAVCLFSYAVQISLEDKMLSLFLHTRGDIYVVILSLVPSPLSPLSSPRRKE